MKKALDHQRSQGEAVLELLESASRIGPGRSLESGLGQRVDMEA